MGSDHHYPEEGPTHAVTVSGFWMDTYTVTNTQFQRFVEETDYVTVAERQPDGHPSDEAGEPSNTARSDPRRDGVGARALRRELGY